MSKECIRTVETKPNIFSQINGIGEKIKGVMVAPRVDCLPQQLRPLVSLVRVHILNKFLLTLQAPAYCVYQNLQISSVPTMFSTFFFPEEKSWNSWYSEILYFSQSMLRLKSWQVKETLFSSGALWDRHYLITCELISWKRNILTRAWHDIIEAGLRIEIVVRPKRRKKGACILCEPASCQKNTILWNF